MDLCGEPSALKFLKLKARDSYVDIRRSLFADGGKKLAMVTEDIRSCSRSVLRCEGEDRVTPLHRCRQIKRRSENAQEPLGSWEHRGLNIKLQAEALRALTEMIEPAPHRLEHTAAIQWDLKHASEDLSAPDKAGSITLRLTWICMLIHRLLFITPCTFCQDNQNYTWIQTIIIYVFFNVIIVAYIYI